MEFDERANLDSTISSISSSAIDDSKDKADRQQQANEALGTGKREAPAPVQSPTSAKAAESCIDNTVRSASRKAADLPAGEADIPPGRKTACPPSHKALAPAAAPIQKATAPSTEQAAAPAAAFPENTATGKTGRLPSADAAAPAAAPFGKAASPSSEDTAAPAVAPTGKAASPSSEDTAAPAAAPTGKAASLPSDKVADAFGKAADVPSEESTDVDHERADDAPLGDPLARRSASPPHVSATPNALATPATADQGTPMATAPADPTTAPQSHLLPHPQLDPLVTNEVKLLASTPSKTAATDLLKVDYRRAESGEGDAPVGEGGDNWVLPPKHVDNSRWSTSLKGSPTQTANRASSEVLGTQQEGEISADDSLTQPAAKLPGPPPIRSAHQQGHESSMQQSEGQMPQCPSARPTEIFSGTSDNQGASNAAFADQDTDTKALASRKQPTEADDQREATNTAADASSWSILSRPGQWEPPLIVTRGFKGRGRGRGRARLATHSILHGSSIPNGSNNPTHRDTKPDVGVPSTKPSCQTALAPPPGASTPGHSTVWSGVRGRGRGVPTGRGHVGRGRARFLPQFNSSTSSTSSNNGVPVQMQHTPQHTPTGGPQSSSSNRLSAAMPPQSTCPTELHPNGPAAHHNGPGAFSSSCHLADQPVLSQPSLNRHMQGEPTPTCSLHAAYV